MNYSVGIDIGGTNTVIGLVDVDGKILRKEKVSTTDYMNEDDFIYALKNKIELLADMLTEEDNLKGVGIGAPNGNYYRGTIEYAPNLPFKGIVKLKESLELLLLRDGYNLNVVVTNDANAAAVGEMIFGDAKDVKDFLMITLGTGLGSGIVVNGNVVYGSTGFAGEVGHTIVEIDGRECNCGRKGCLERYASATGIVLTAKEKLHQTEKDSLLRAIDEDKITSKDIYDAALQKDDIALECFDYTAKMLAVGLANACEITSPQKVFLFGGLAQSGDLLLVPLKKYIEENLFSIFNNTVEIVLSSLDGENAAVLGAAALVY